MQLVSKKRQKNDKDDEVPPDSSGSPNLRRSLLIQKSGVKRSGQIEERGRFTDIGYTSKN